MIVSVELEKRSLGDMELLINLQERPTSWIP